MKNEKAVVGNVMNKRDLLPIGLVALLIAIILIGNTCSGNRNHSNDHTSCTENGDSMTIDEVDETDYDSCENNDYVSPVIPAFVKNLIEGAEWVAETLCVVKNKTYFLAFDGCGNTFTIYDDKRVLAEDPALRVDSTSTGCKHKFYVSVAGKYKLIDFSNTQSVKSLSTLTRNLPSFKRFRKDSTALKDHAYFSLTADFPTECVVHADEIRRWLVNRITNPNVRNKNWEYEGDQNNHEQIAKYASNMFFDSWKEIDDDDNPLHVFSVLNYKAKVANNRFVTYQQYTHEYEGGAHGYFTERLISYDHVHKQEIDFNYLFIPDGKQQLQKILVDISLQQPMYKDFLYDINEYVCATDKAGNPTGELRFPRPGLSDEGIVFSFQPYDISCFAAGVLHFTIPYERIKHLMTPMGKWCIGYESQDGSLIR